MPRANRALIFFLVVVLSVVAVPKPAWSIACPWGTNCIAVVQLSPAEGATLSGTVTLDSTAKQTMPERGEIWSVEAWLYHPSFAEQNPNNHESKILLNENKGAPVSGTRMDGRWQAAWTIVSTMTTRDGDYEHAGLRTYTLPDDGRQYKIEHHILDQEWRASWGGPPGRSGQKNVAINFGTPPPPPTGCAAPSWSADFFQNITLSGAPTLSRCDAQINNFWPGATGPAPSVAGSNFSARWTSTPTFTAGSYKFDATSDDGVRVKLDGAVIIDGWSAHGPTPYTAARTLTAGPHTLVVEYYEQYGDATAKFSYIPMAGPPSPSPTPPAGCFAPAFSAQYFNGIALSGAPVLSRCDSAINFSLGAGSPGAGVPADLWSARWASSPTLAAGDYKFNVTSDDGVRVKVDGVTIIDKWFLQGPTAYTVTKAMTAGVHSIVVEYYENQGGSTIQFSYAASGLATIGRWTTTASMPVRAAHATLLSDGRVLLIAGSGNDPSAFSAGSFKSAVWNPITNTFVNISSPTDMFCSGHVTLPNGKVLIAGGTLSYPGAGGEVAYRGAKYGYVFDPVTSAYARTNDTIEGHWYPTLTKVETGNVWAVGGYSHNSGPARSTELFNSATGQWMPAAGVPQTNAYWGTYPHVFLMADGRLFYTGGHTFGGAYPGSGVFIHDWQAKTFGDIPGLRDKQLRDQAGSVLLPPAQNQTFMIAGGGSTDNGGATNKVDIVNLTQASPSYAPGPDLPGVGRLYLNLTTLPDRTVLASNGGTGNRTGSVLSASIYSPTANSWAPVAPDPVGRNYHSSALLLPDGRVVIFGSNPVDGSFELQISIYEPPYLFKGPRPAVASVPAEVSYGQSFNLGVAGNVVSASLTAPGSATHQTDTNARLVDLPISGAGASRIAIVPANRALLPPGPYLLSVLDTAGVPSVAKWISIR